MLNLYTLKCDAFAYKPNYINFDNYCSGRVQNFCGTYYKKKFVGEHKIEARNIYNYNVDESGFTTVQTKSPKGVSQREKHQVGFIANGWNYDTGLWPIDRNFFKNSDFVASENLQGKMIVDDVENSEGTKGETLENIPTNSSNVQNITSNEMQSNILAHN
ncbi:hypothetical protein FQA39_LY04659 [Lamprigera yunnana]|nr:hypothetical protein FQA39_LY04659 [Lamprigera yunnana]